MTQTHSITLLDGRTLTCYENNTSEQPISNQLQLDTTGTYFRVGRSACTRQSKVTKAESPHIESAAQDRRKLFLTYFHTFYSHRERILSDSRMFLARIPMRNGLAYTGTSGFECPTLGVLIEWLLHTPNATEQDADGRVWMVCGLAGSPLSGSNRCTLVDGEGNTNVQQLDSFASLWRPFMHINGLYDDAKVQYQHYTLEEVVEIFTQEGLLQLDQNEITILHLNNQIANLKRQITYAEERDRKRTADFHQALMKRHFDQLCTMVAELEQQLSDREQRLQQIYALRADLRNRLKNKEISPRDYQQPFAPFNREREEILNFCRNRSTAHICNALFDGEYISLKEMQHFITHFPQTERNNKLSNLIEAVRCYAIRHQ